MGLEILKTDELPNYTYDDYVQWEGRWEVIDGIPYAMGPTPKRPHQKIAVKIMAQLEHLLENCDACQTFPPIDWQITEHTIVQPDVSVVCDEDPDEAKLTRAPVMVFEILSPSTERRDRGVKYRLYENAGVKYYCIVDPKSKNAEVYTLGKTQYQDKEEFEVGKIHFQIGACSIAFDFGKIFT